MAWKIFVALAMLAPAPTWAADATPTGFTCTAADGSVKRLNIDLKRSRYDDGQGTKRLYRVTDTTITLRGPNPDTIETPLGPILSTLELDRTSLVLTDQTLAPDRNVNRTTTYQCQTGPAHDFKAGRRF